MIYKIGLIAILISSICSYSYPQISEIINLKKAIICLTYDDGFETQLLNVIPQIDSVDFRSTFFLNSIKSSFQSAKIGKTPEMVLGWTSAAKNGHELANPRKESGMGVYQFHGIGGQVFQISKEAHRAFLQYLKVHLDDY